MSCHSDEHLVGNCRLPESHRTPALSLLLGYGAMVPFAAAAVAAWLLEDRWRILAVDLAILWGGAILTFLSGVRRGLSFRTVDGPTSGQIVTTLWLFVLGLSALAAPWPAVALTLLLAGFFSTGVLDPLAARRGEVPPFFVRLRPVQMLIPVASLVALLLLVLTRH